MEAVMYFIEITYIYALTVIAIGPVCENPRITYPEHVREATSLEPRKSVLSQKNNFG